MHCTSPLGCDRVNQVYLQTYNPPLATNHLLLAANSTVWALAKPDPVSGNGSGTIAAVFPALSTAACSGGFSVSFDLLVTPEPNRDDAIADGFSVGFVASAPLPHAYSKIQPLALGVGTGCPYVSNAPAVHLVLDMYNNQGPGAGIGFVQVLSDGHGNNTMGSLNDGGTAQFAINTITDTAVLTSHAIPGYTGGYAKGTYTNGSFVNGTYVNTTYTNGSYAPGTYGAPTRVASSSRLTRFARSASPYRRGQWSFCVVCQQDGGARRPDDHSDRRGRHFRCGLHGLVGSDHQPDVLQHQPHVCRRLLPIHRAAPARA